MLWWNKNVGAVIDWGRWRRRVDGLLGVDWGNSIYEAHSSFWWLWCTKLWQWVQEWGSQLWIFKQMLLLILEPNKEKHDCFSKFYALGISRRVESAFIFSDFIWLVVFDDDCWKQNICSAFGGSLCLFHHDKAPSLPQQLDPSSIIDKFCLASLSLTSSAWLHEGLYTSKGFWTSTQEERFCLGSQRLII